MTKRIAITLLLLTLTYSTTEARKWSPDKYGDVPKVVNPVIGCDETGPISIWTCSGQSNMVGYADSDFSIPWDSTVLVYDATEDDWVTAIEPLNRGLSWLTPGDKNLFPAFADWMHRIKTKQYGRETYCPIGVVMVAFPGQDIARWIPDHPVWNNYEWWLAGTEAALAAAPEGSVLEGALWLQGESDAPIPAKVSAWSASAEIIFASFRSDIGYPNLPVVMGHIGSWVTGDTAGINAAIDTAAAAIGNATTVSSDGTTEGTANHFNAEGYDIMGRRFAREWWELISQ